MQHVYVEVALAQSFVGLVHVVVVGGDVELHLCFVRCTLVRRVAVIGCSMCTELGGGVDSISYKLKGMPLGWLGT